MKSKWVLTDMIILAGFLGLGTLAFFLLYNSCHQAWMLSFAITLLFFFYHFAMRLIVGEMVTILYRNKSFPQDRMGFRIYSFEKGLYQKLKVRRWKMHVITAKPEQFDLKMVTPEKLLHNVMRAERENCDKCYAGRARKL